MGLKELLYDMLVAAENKDLTEVKRLNLIFENDIPKSIQSYNDYDNLRQSCVIGLVNPDMYDMLIADARKRFDRLYKRKIIFHAPHLK